MARQVNTENTTSVDMFCRAIQEDNDDMFCRAIQEDNDDMFCRAIQEDNDAMHCLIFPHIPPPPLPRKNIRIPMKRPVNLNDQHKCGLEAQDTDLIDLITFEDEEETEELTEIAPEDSRNYTDGVPMNRDIEHVNVESENEQSLDNLFKDDLLKYSFDFVECRRTSQTPDLDIFSNEDVDRQHTSHYTATNPFISITEPAKQIFSTPKPLSVHSAGSQHLSDATATNPFIPIPQQEKQFYSTVQPRKIHSAGKAHLSDATATNPFISISEPEEQIHSTLKTRTIEKYSPFQQEKIAFGFESSVDNGSGENYQKRPRLNEEVSISKSLCELNIFSGEDNPDTPDIVGQAGRDKQQNNPFLRKGTFDIVTKQNDHESCLQNSVVDETMSSTDPNSVECHDEIHTYDCDNQIYHDTVVFNSNSWPKVHDMNKDHFIQCTSETGQLPALPSPCSVDKSTGLYLNTTQHGSQEKQDCVVYDYPANCQSGEIRHRYTSSDDEGEYITMSPIVSKCRTHINKNKAVQQSSWKYESGSDAKRDPDRTKKAHPFLTSQRSLSDSDICGPNVFGDSKLDAGVAYDCNDGRQMKKHKSKDNGKFNEGNFLTKFFKRNRKNSQLSTAKPGGYLNLFCPCGGSCDRIGNLVTSSEGQMWVSFLHCTWVSLYDHRLRFLHKFDAGGIVDDLAVSPAGVLYISCPRHRKILMLTTNLELGTMCHFNKLHPRGLAISPIDGSVVACLTSEELGHLMTGSSNNSLMKFAGKRKNEEGKVLNKGDFLGYPMRLAININGYILVSDFGLRCMFVLNQGGLMLKKLTILGERQLCQVHSITHGHGETFYVVHGGRGRLIITRLQEHRGCVTQETSRRLDPDIYCKVRASTVTQRGQLVVTSGSVVKYISPD
ncbi:uncharacterized protein LOC117317859 [Pecten maximus]|uniref:uncharacterized protein LOC117317859 n=1 Tax=Pecten maximus TaxID=6579 RepID=UPI0014586AF5|nr:uncharacterized protein LOC117317859 [Pecten maximus]